MNDATDDVLDDVKAEREAQTAKWGVQSHPDGTARKADKALADRARRLCDDAAVDGSLTWRHILDEEQAEAYAEDDLDELRAELVQTAAVIVAWIEDIDARRANGERVNEVDGIVFAHGVESLDEYEGEPA